jgi:hypothetical protein
VSAILTEYRASRRSVWAAAAILAMAPLLRSLARVRRTASDERDEESIVVSAFLEAVNLIATSDRIALRLYSETRRRVLHPRRAWIEDVCQRSGRDVDAIAGTNANAIEPLIDRARFVVRARASSPQPGESLAAYVERLMPSLTGRERSGRRAQLSNQRHASLADLREAFRSITATQPQGETR